MNKLVTVVCSLAFCASSASAQGVTDIGLRVTTANGVSAGQQCGAVTCTPIGPVSAVRGTSLTFGPGSAPFTPFVLAIGFPGPCVTFAGIDNVLVLDPTTAVPLTFGLMGNEPFVPTPCNQGAAIHILPIPAGAPVGLGFLVQNLGQSNSGALGFGPALSFVVQ